MQIERLILYDFRGIHELELELNGKSTILYGINGVGKSSILAAVNLLYANIINKIVNQKFKQSIKFEESDIKYKKAAATIAAEFGFEDTKETFCFSRQNHRANTKVIKPVKNQFDELIDHFRQLYIGRVTVDDDNNLVYQNEKFNLPIFINYGVNRLVLKTPLRINKKQSYGQFAAYEKAIENQIAFDRLFEWFLEQELYEIQLKKENKDYEDISLKAVKTAMLAMLDGYKEIHIAVKPYSMKVYKGNEVLDILQRSDGEKCTLALFGDLARRLALANPGLENPLEGEGIVLIDEIELHMHPSWQRKVLGVLRRTFPNIQFIITTHSPQILGEADDSYNIYVLTETDHAECEVKTIKRMDGYDSNMILEKYMNTHSKNIAVKKMICDINRFITQKQYHDAEILLEHLEEISGSMDEEYIMARGFLKRSKLLDEKNK